MAYLGQAPINGFHAKQSLSGDGSTVTFTLDRTVATESSIIVSVGGVIQEPSVAYDLTIGGTKITFTEAPSSTDTVYIQYLGQAVVTNLLDLNGVQFILDEDGDTSLTADTDDEIDIRVGGADINTIKATGFHNIDSIKYVAGAGDDLEIYHDGTNSFVANKTGALKLATETSGIAVTIGHTTSEVTIADNATVTGNLTVTGTLTQTGTQTFDGGIDVDNFNINGTTIALSSGDMLLDSAGDIILDAAGDTIFLKDAGTTFGSLDNTSGNLIIKSGTTTALTFAGANATLAGTLGVGAVTSTGIVTGTAFTAGSAVLAEAELELLDGLTAGTAIASKVVTTDANIDTTGQRNLTISGELDAATGDFSGDVDIDGTLEADAITVNGTALASVIAGTTVNLATLASTVTITDNESTDENNSIIFTAGGDVDGGSLGLESDGDLTYNPSSGTLNVPNISVTGTQTIVNSVTMNASNAVIFEGATADAHETTLSTVDATADRTINLPNQSGTLPVLAAASATAITSTPEELNILDGATVVVGEINALDIGATAVGTAVASKAVILDSDKDYTGIRNLTISGELDAATLDISSSIDIAGASQFNSTITVGVDDTGYDVKFFGATTGKSLLWDESLDTLVVTGNATISGTATTTGVHTFTAIPVLPANTIDSAMYVDGSIDTAHHANNAITYAKLQELSTGNRLLGAASAGNIGEVQVVVGMMAANSVDSDQYVDGSIDAAHLADDSVTEAKMAANSVDSQAYVDASIDTAHIGALQVTGAKLALDHRSANATDDVKTGNQHDYLFFDADVGISFFTANAEDMRLTDAGVLHVDDDIIAFSSTISDERLKENIKPIENALSKVNQLNGMTFTYISDGKESAGLIAQDVEKVLPSAVKEMELPLKIDDGNEYKVLQYDQTIGLLVEAIKELTTKIEKLEKK